MLLWATGLHRLFFNRSASSDTLFIDDRVANIAAAERLGIRGQFFNHNDPAETCDALRRMLL